jgi:hypothetical protein
MGVAPEGTLALANGELTFNENSGCTLRAPLSSIANPRSPWYMIGCGFCFRLGTVKYSATFNKLTSFGALSTGGPLSEILGTGAGIADPTSAAKLNAA